MLISNHHLRSRRKGVWFQGSGNILNQLVGIFSNLIIPENETICKVDITPYGDSVLQLRYHLLNCSVRAGMRNGEVVIGSCTFDGKTGTISSDCPYLECELTYLGKGTYRLKVKSDRTIFKIETLITDQQSTTTCSEFIVSV